MCQYLYSSRGLQRRGNGLWPDQVACGGAARRGAAQAVPPLWLVGPRAGRSAGHTAFPDIKLMVPYASERVGMAASFDFPLLVFSCLCSHSPLRCLTTPSVFLFARVIRFAEVRVKKRSQNHTRPGRASDVHLHYNLRNIIMTKVSESTGHLLSVRPGYTQNVERGILLSMGSRAYCILENKTSLQGIILKIKDKERR